MTAFFAVVAVIFLAVVAVIGGCVWTGIGLALLVDPAEPNRPAGLGHALIGLATIALGVLTIYGVTQGWSA